MSDNYQTLEQRRAQDALPKIDALKYGDREIGENYRSYVEALPAMIVMNGLGQAFATVLSRSQGEKAREKAYRLLYDHCQDWLFSVDNIFPKYNGTEGGNQECRDLITAIVNNNQDVYLHAQVEALAYLDWLKKFAQAYLPKGERE